MTPEFLSAVVDTLLPGDAATPPLPSGTEVGIAERLAEHVVASRDRARHDAVLHAIADAARGEDAFVRADAAERISSVKRVEAEMGEPFRAFVSLLLQDYYETDAVLVAIGSRAEPPQPDGHVIAPFDETLLDPVRRRGPMWR